MPVSFTWTFSADPTVIPAGVNLYNFANNQPSAAALAGAAALRDKALDPLTDDLLLDGGADQIYTSGISGIADNLKANWLFFKGEWFLDLNKGVDYWGVIFKKGSTIEACEEEFRREALATQGVAAIVLAAKKTTGRTLVVNAQVTTDTGLIFNASLGVAAGG